MNRAHLPRPAGPARRRLFRPPMLRLPRDRSLTARPPPVLDPKGVAPARDHCAAAHHWALLSRQGRRRLVREDAYFVYPPSSSSSLASPSSSSSSPDPDPQHLRLFCLFDGHGGVRASQFAAETLPKHILAAYRAGTPLLEALPLAFTATHQDFSAACSTSTSSNSTSTSTSTSNPSPDRVPNPTPTVPFARTSSGSSFAAIALQTAELPSFSLARPPAPPSASTSDDPPRPPAPTVSLSRHPSSDTSAASVQPRPVGHHRRRKSRADDQLASVAVPCSAHSCGTTATVIALFASHLTVAHVGDSRAVLCRQGLPVRLFEDHRPDRPDELLRIEKAGGIVIPSRTGNCSRVNGVLSVSRAIGDLGLSDLVISTPEVRTLQLSALDEFLVMATDGLWDVVSDQRAVESIRDSLFPGERGEQKSNNESAEQEAARKLVAMACDEGTKDDISVLVVNLVKHRDDTRRDAEDPLDGLTDDIAVSDMVDGGLITSRRRTTKKEW